MNTICKDDHGRDHGHGQDYDACCGNVEIYVNNQKVVLQPGRYEVPTFKRIACVPLADDLDELVDCKLKFVPDNATLCIEGCEVFISHVKDGGAS